MNQIKAKPLQQLNHLCLIRISGDDASTFLQGQLTNDINQSHQQWQHSGYCNPKGRLLALLQIFKLDEHYYALLEKDLLDTITRRLRMYVMRSKVTIAEVADQYFYSSADWSTISSHFAELDQPLAQKISQHNQHIALLSAHQYLVISPQLLDAPIDNSSWLQSHIHAGMPRVTAATSEAFVPQMLNLDLLNGINFKKGCYTGQEIVARMHYLGKLKQRMFVCSINGDTAQAGENIYADATCQQAVGNVVSACAGDALAVLRLQACEQNSQFHLNNATQLTVNKVQPYELVANL